ncbi:MAG: NAD(P)H-dependent oxidoreductase [Candidatus Methanofastidiosia archaeon]|jgi:flavodoxin
MKTLVVYYSRTGHTKKVAKAIADTLSSDIEEIVDGQNRSGPIGFLRSGYQAYRKSLIDIKDLKKDVSEYDVVIIGTPVWAGTVSSPVRTFLHIYKDYFNKVAFFSTHGGDEPQKEFNEMKATCGKTPVCTASFSEKEADANRIEDINQFAAELKALE